MKPLIHILNLQLSLLKFSILFVIIFTLKTEAQSVKKRLYLSPSIAFAQSIINIRDPFRSTITRTRPVSAVHGSLGIQYRMSPSQTPNFTGSIQLSILHAKRGYKQLLNNDRPTFLSEMYYIEVPLYTKYIFRLNRNKKYKILLNTGVFYEQLYRVENTNVPPEPLEDAAPIEPLPPPAEEDTEETEPEEAPDEVYIFRDGFDKKRGFGLRVGFGIEREIGKHMIQFEIEGSFSLQDYLRSNRLINDIPFESKHSAWLLHLTYLLPLTKTF